MTEEQKTCKYCHFENHGANFAEDDDTCHFQLESHPGERYYIAVWRGFCGEDFDVGSDFIHYCPMCGRKLGKEE